MSGGLQYRKSTSFGSGSSLRAKAAVDWEAFDEALARVDPCFSDPRFDSLKHVLTVLSSNNAEQEVEELREQRDAIEQLVDAVVEGYHAGFNKSIHNYSQILRLFTESKIQLDSLRRSLQSAGRRLGAQSRHMVAQYQRDLMLTDTLRLLDDIQGCLDVPARVARLEESKEWPLAVSLLLDGCNKLARQELQAVGALSEVGEEMGRRRTALQASLVAELEARAYRLDGAGLVAGRTGHSAARGFGAGGGSLLAPGGVGGEGGSIVPRLVLPGGASRLQGGGQEADFTSAAGNLSGRGLPPRPPQAFMGRQVSGWGRESGRAASPAFNATSAAAAAAAALAAAGGSASEQPLMPSLSSMPRRPTHRRALTLGGLAPAASGMTAVDGHIVEADLPMSALVDCVAQLGGLHEAQAAVRRHMPAQLRAVIGRAVESFPASLRLPLDGYAGGLPRRREQAEGRGSGSSSSDDISVPRAVAATAAALLDHILACCMQAFQQVTCLLQMLSLARVPKASSGLELLLRQQRQHQQQHQATAAALPRGSNPAAAAAVGPPGVEATKAEVAAAWECMQVECQRLLACLLAAPAPAQQAQRGEEAGSDVPLAGWLASVGSDLEAAGQASPTAASAAEAGTLSFCLDHEVPGLITKSTSEAAGGSGDGSGGGGSGACGDLHSRIQSILGGHPGGLALVASLYRPVLSFVEAAERHVSSLQGAGAGADAGGGRKPALLSMPWLGGAEAAAMPAERSLLRSYVESFLRMEFLPAVYVSARARCSSALEDSDAFKPRSRLRAAYQAGAGAEGRPVLPAALATEQMVEELLGWAAQVPPFATHLTGVVENVLGRVLDACEGQMAALLGGSAAGRLAESLPVVQLMVKEPAAALLGSPVAFFVGRNTDAMESFVSSVIAAGFGANDEAVECGILQRLLGERPVAAASLLSGSGDVARLASLAALSDSLDYVAEAIHRCTAPAGGGGSGGGTGVAAGGSAAGMGGASLYSQLSSRINRQSTDGGSSGAATPVAGERTGGGGGSGDVPAGPGASSAPTWQQQLLGGRFKPWRKAGSGEPGALTEGLSHLSDRYRAVAGQCVRALRLDLLLLVLHHLQQLPRSSYVCREEEAREVDECVAALARLVGRLDEGLQPYLPPHKRAYVFGSLAAAAARFVVWLLPDIRGLNHMGVQRMCRMLASLQPALSGVGGSGSVAGSNGGTSTSPAAAFRSDAARQFDRAKLYYTLLTYSAEGLIATVAERPHRFTAQEYLVLLAADVAERQVTPEHRAALHRVLTDAGSLAKPANKALAGAIAAAVKAIKQ